MIIRTCKHCGKTFMSDDYGDVLCSECTPKFKELVDENERLCYNAAKAILEQYRFSKKHSLMRFLDGIDIVEIKRYIEIIDNAKNNKETL